MNTPEPPLCSRCGAPLPADAPSGLCPACLMAMNFATETILPEAPAASPTAPLSPAELAPLFPLLEILECLGRGGMGVVYKARQKSLNRLVALKLLAPERAADAEFARRFASEAEALARLSHPNIVTVYDFGEAEGRFYYLLMEFVDGVNLRQAMTAGRMAPAQALAIVPPICEALQYAHEHGIVHRDIKPENLLLDKAGHVKIADFGIAKMLRAEPSAIGVAESRAAGTPRYMAPEQLRDPKAVDHRADIYSLGVVLYEMLTGELPSEPFKVPTRKVELDVRLNEIVIRALQHSPELRYHTARDMQTQIETLAPEAVTPPKPASAPPVATPTTEPLPPHFWRRLAITGAVLVLLLLGFATPKLLRPRMYLARVTMEVRPESYPRVQANYWQSSPPAFYDAKFFATQAQVLRKSELLRPVVMQLNLAKYYSSRGTPVTLDGAIQKLASAVSVEEVRNTGLIELGVYDRDPQMAADIANTLSVVYRNKRIEDIQRALDVGLAQFQDEVTKQQRAVEESAVQAARLRQKLGIADPDPEGTTPPPNAPIVGKSSEEALDYVTAKTRYVQSKKILEAAETRLSTARMDEHIDGEPVKIWQRAEKPSEPVSRFSL